jgi:hypothetical protein
VYTGYIYIKLAENGNTWGFLVGIFLSFFTFHSKFASSVADPGCLSRIRLFSIPDPTFFHPGSELFPSRIRIKELKYFNPKKWFLSSRKYDGCSSRIPDPDLDFLPRVSNPHWFNADPDTDPDPTFFLIAVSDSGSRSRIRIPDPDPGSGSRVWWSKI